MTRTGSCECMARVYGGDPVTGKTKKQQTPDPTVGAYLARKPTG